MVEIEKSKLNRKQIAWLVRLSPGRITQLRDAGIIHANPDGSYPLEAAREYWKFKEDEGKSDVPVLEELDRERLRKLKRENDIEEGLVAPVSLLTDALQKSGSIIIANLESLPLIMKRNWPEITGDQITMVKKSIAECRNAITDMEVDVE